MIEFLCIAVSFGIFVMLWKSRMNYLALPRIAHVTGKVANDITVIIPARNEAHQIQRVINSFQNVPVIVVDDGSSDNTAAIARSAGATVIPAPALPEGAKGKPNACAEGARAAATKWILFVDADTWFQPDFLASLVEYAQAHSFDMVTAFLQQHCETLSEKMLLPYAFGLYFTGVSARSVNGKASGQALANGQCILFLRSAYEQIGGHTGVLNSVIEDVALAQSAKRSGLALCVARAEHLGHVRMYDSLAAIWRGFQKNSFRFLQVNPWSGMQVIFSSILLTSWLPLVVMGLRDYPNFSASLMLQPTPVWLLFFVPFLTLLPWYAARFSHSGRVLLAPFAIYLFQLIALNGMLVTLTRRSTTWKGRGV